MADQYIGEIKIVAFTFAPQGWALCNGQLLSISQNTALFSLLGTTYGGNGTTNFALPNLQSRIPMHQGLSTTGTSYPIGEAGGVESVTLLTSEIPSHTHTLTGSSESATTVAPANEVLAMPGRRLPYAPSSSTLATMSGQSVGPNSGGQPHENRQPFLAVNFIIALYGIFPPRT